MKKEFFIVLFLFFSLCITIKVNAQDDSDSTESLCADTTKLSKWSVTGYLKDLQYVQFEKVNEQWTLDNLIHNRIDVHWYPSSNWKIHVGLRNRFFYGESVALYEQNESLLNNSNGFLDLGKVIVKGKSYLLHSMIDRASVDYMKGKWEITAGRQRINWGLNLVWNPNDIFNAYSYFDFDYEERPGTDAVRVQHYLNSTSSAELAYKPGKTFDKTILAGLYRFNLKNYDVQLLAGKYNSDYALGGGWSGLLGTAGLNGEITAFIPDGTSHNHTEVSASLGANYTFSNSLYLHGAYLFNSTGSNGNSINIAEYLLTNASAKFLSPSEHSVFAEAAYQLSPLIRGDIAGILNPAEGSFFLGPFFNFSLTNNIEFLSGSQLFLGKKGSLYGGYGALIYLRLKWSF